MSLATSVPGVEVLASLAVLSAVAAAAGAQRSRVAFARGVLASSRRPDVADPARVGRGASQRAGSRIGSLPVIRILGMRAERRRLRAADAEVPQLLDLLAAASSSGLAASLAFNRSVEALTGPLGHELREALGRVELGERWQDQLDEVARRLGLHDLKRTVAVLARTETLGTPLAGACAELAEEVRSARRAATTERARTAPVKMLFPLVFLVLPAFLLLTVVPVLLTTVQSIR